MAGCSEKEALMRTMDRMITELEKEELVDEIFRFTASLREVHSSHFFANLLPTFICETRNAIRDMNSILAQAEVNYHQLDLNGVKVYGSSSSIGAFRLANACNSLRDQTEAKDRQQCLQSLNRIKEEFGKIYDRFNAIAELERRIADMTDNA